MHTEIDWDDRYKNTAEKPPWDIGSTAPELQEAFEELELAGRPVLEIGCGTGTNAIWMAQQKCKVVATDISPTAIEAAVNKTKEAKVEVEYAISDICQTKAVADGAVDFVFDRGVYHVMIPEKRGIFAERVAQALSTGGYWLCMAGSKDEVREDPDKGPPQLSAVEVLEPMEKFFEIHRLHRAHFVLPNGHKHVAWIVLVRKR